jgi:hypothetical protein
MKMLNGKQGKIDLTITPMWKHGNAGSTQCQLGSKDLLPIPVLAGRLEDILNSGYRIGQVEIDGGELTLMPEEYLYSLKWILHYYGITDIVLITNLTSITSSVIMDDQFSLAVSYDFEHTEQQEKVWNNLVNLQRPFSILTVACEDVVKSNPTSMVEEINSLHHCLSWEIRPYGLKKNVFDDFIKSISDQPNKRFQFYNTEVPQETIKRPYGEFSGLVLHITPSGQYGLVEADLEGNEYLLETNNLFQYLDRISNG